MDPNFYYFLKYESSPSYKILNEVASTVRYVDIFFPSKRVLGSDFFGSNRFNSLRKLVNEYDITFNSSVLDSIYLLRGFGMTQKVIKELYNNGYKTINRVVKLDSYEFNTVTNSKTNSTYNKISDAITGYSNWRAENLDVIIETLILDYLQLMDERVSINSLLIYIKKFFTKRQLTFSENQFYFTLNEMQENLLIDRNLKGAINIHNTSLEEILSYDFQDSDIFSRYLNGFTLNEIAESRGVTRSRIQQVFARALERLPTLNEDKRYKKLFERYDFSEEDFKKIFNETNEVYRYINYKYTKGSESVINYLIVNDYSHDFVSEFLREHGYYYNQNDEIKKINFLNILDLFLYKNRRERFTYEEALHKVNPYLKKYGLEEYSADDLRTFKARIEYSKSALASNDGRFRYYNCAALDKNQINILEKCFDLPDGVYGSEKIFDLNKEIMKEFQLLNGQELLDLYNKLELDVPSVTRIIRRTEVQIGRYDKPQFIEEVIREFNGESLKDITWYLSDEYGLNEGSTINYISKNFGHMFVNNIVAIAKPKTEIVAIATYLNNFLEKEIYLLRNINNIVSKHFNESISLNNIIFENTDYKVHKRHIIKKSYGSSYEAMKDVISKSSIYRTPDSQLAKDSVFYNAMNALLRERAIFKVSENTYINKERLEEGKIYEADILDFIESIEKYDFPEGGYLTMKSLLKEGFHHKLLDIGFESVFYEEILRSSPKLGVINTMPLIVYRKTGADKKLSDFIYSILDANRAIDYQDLINLLLNTYGLSYDASSLREILSDTPAYYSHETEKFYNDKEQYYLEVYGK